MPCVDTVGLTSDSLFPAEATVPTIAAFGKNLELAGKGIMYGETVPEIGEKLLVCGQELEILSAQISGYSPSASDSALAGQRMNFAAERMKDAGYELTGTKPESDKPKGKSWIKG